jgi:hypothetical protein
MFTLKVKNKLARCLGFGPENKIDPTYLPSPYPGSTSSHPLGSPASRPMIRRMFGV